MKRKYKVEEISSDKLQQGIMKLGRITSGKIGTFYVQIENGIGTLYLECGSETFSVNIGQTSAK